MTNLNLVCLDFKECDLIPTIKSSLSEILSSSIDLSNLDLNLEPYFNQDRSQYDAGLILSGFDETMSQGRTILLTSVDLFIPIFTFVFGLAKLNGAVGIVSDYRLRSEFYGLPSDENLLMTRILKEIVHEFGHLLNLRHCIDYRCVMASSNTADDLDVKGNHFCRQCLDKI